MKVASRSVVAFPAHGLSRPIGMDGGSRNFGGALLHVVCTVLEQHAADAVPKAPRQTRPRSRL